LLLIVRAESFTLESLENEILARLRADAALSSLPGLHCRLRVEK
jgi:hypothetical protein